MAALISGSFFAIHAVMICLFWSFGVTPMVYFNVFSLVFYASSFILIHKELLRLYSALTYLEVVFHMVLAAFCTGWENGFQVTLIGMSALLFFAEYMGRSLGIRHIHALPLCALGMCMYLGAYVACSYYPAPYSLPADVTFWLQIGWGVIVFAVSVLVLQAFITVTFTSERTLADKLEHDNLTGLPNRSHMAHYLEAASREAGLEGCWLAMVDLDDFKVVNDTHGHNCGDAMLKEFAVILQEGSEGLEVCRWGGEEFLVAGRLSSADATEMRDRLERLRKAVAEHTFWHGEKRLGITMTAGAALYEEGDSVTEWVNRADRKLYEGKASGKNRIVA